VPAAAPPLGLALRERLHVLRRDARRALEQADRPLAPLEDEQVAVAPPLDPRHAIAPPGRNSLGVHRRRRIHVVVGGDGPHVARLPPGRGYVCAAAAALLRMVPGSRSSASTTGAPSRRIGTPFTSTQSIPTGASATRRSPRAGMSRTRRIGPGER